MRVVFVEEMTKQLDKEITANKNASPPINHIELSVKEWDQLVFEINQRNPNNQMTKNSSHMFYCGVCIRKAR